MYFAASEGLKMLQAINFKGLVVVNSVKKDLIWAGNMCGLAIFWLILAKIVSKMHVGSWICRLRQELTFSG